MSSLEDDEEFEARKHEWQVIDRHAAFVVTSSSLVWFENPYTAVHRRRSGLSCCRCPYLEQSASGRHVRTLYVCFPTTPESFPLQAFLPMTRYRNFCTACALRSGCRHFRTLKSFFLLTYLLVYLSACSLAITLDGSLWRSLRPSAGPVQQLVSE